MSYTNRDAIDRIAKAVAELVELASYRDIGASAQCADSLCSALGIHPCNLETHLSAELLEDPDFFLKHSNHN
jgi:hypothetical protein